MVARRVMLQLGAAAPAAALLPANDPVPVAPPPDPFPDGTFAFWCLGDSITAGSTEDGANGIAAGYPADLVTGNGYRKYLLDWLRGPNETNAKMVGALHSGTAQLWHDGHPGWTLGQIGSLVTGAGLAPQFVVLLGGVNDFGQGRTWDQARDDTAAILDKLTAWAPWVRVVLCEQVLASGLFSHDRTVTTAQQQALNASLAALVDAYAGRVVVARTGLVSSDMVDSHSSGVHPLDVGYRWMAYTIYHAMRPWLGRLVGPDRWMTNIPVPPGSPRPLYALP